MKLTLKQAWHENFKIQPVNLALMAIIVVMYVWEVLISQNLTISVTTLYNTGAQYTPTILFQHEWWRLITAGFLHITPTHLLFNLVVMYFIGKLLEWQIGHFRYLILFFVAVLIGNLTSLAFGDLNGISAGASGGIYGLFGAVVGIGVLDRFHDFWRRESFTIGVLVVISLLMGFTREGIDMYAHIGGIVSGLALSPILVGTSCKTGSFNIKWWGRLLSALVTIAIAGLLLYVALHRGI